MRTRSFFIVAAGLFICHCSQGGYVTDDLVLRYDAIDNAGVGVHSDSPSVWADLSGNGHDLTLPASGLTVGADTMTFDHASGSVSGISCLTAASGTNLTLEVVCAADESFDTTLTSARMLASNPRISLYFRQVGAQHVVGGIYYDGAKRQFCGAPVRRCDWNSKQFICRFHTYSLRTKSNGGSVAVDGSEYATLQSSFYNDAASLTDVLTVGSATAFYKIKSVRLYSRQLTVAEAARNAAEDEARFSIKPTADANGNVNAFDDAAFYFRSARQALNSYLDNFEFANALYLGAADNPPGDTFTVGGSRANIAVETIDVPAPYAGKTLKNRSVVHFKQPYNEGDTTKASTSNITLSQPVAATNKASYTVMVRFKLDSRINPDPASTGQITLLELGYGWSAPSGLSLQLRGPADNLWVRALHGGDADDFTDMQSDSTKTLKAGEWVDMALVVSGRDNYLYYKTESGGLYTGRKDTNVGLTSATWGLYKLALGGPANGDGVGGSATTSSTTCFRGWYQQVAIWDRALSRDEVLNAFRDGCDDGDEWKVGVANDMSLEFAGSGAATLETVNDWKDMKGALSAENDAVSVNFDLAAGSYAKVRTFKFKTTSVSAGGVFNLAVNGRTVAENVASTAGQSAVVTVPGGFFASGANTLTVTRTDSNAGKMEIDCLSLVVAEGNVPAVPAVAGDPLSGAYRWYRHDGSAFKDILRTAYPNSSAHNWTLRGDSGNFVHTTADVNCPYRGVMLTGEDCVYLKQESYTNANGVIYGKGGCMYASIFPVSNTVAYTAFARFKIDSFQNPTNCKAQVLGIGYEWANSRGMCLSLQGTNPENLYIHLSGGKTNFAIKDPQSGEVKNRLAQGKWIDIAVVVSNNCGCVYACVEGGDFQNLGSHSFGSGGMGVPNTWSGMYLGQSSGRSATSWSSADDDKSYFRGWVHQAAVWPHALSEKDVKAVFGFPSPDIVRIGVENGSAAEFYGSAAASYTYPANADFRDAPSVIPAGGSLTLTFNLAAGDVRSQLLKIASTDASDSATFAVSVNGNRVVNYTAQYAPFNEFAVAPGGSVIVGVLSRYLQVGANIVTLTRIDSGTAAFEIDALSFGNGDKVPVRGSGFAISFR